MEPEIFLVIPPLLLAIIIHEVAHAVVARRLGDDTAFMLGRITLNPVAHVDVVGTIIFPLVQLLLSGRVFIAWAKPVPINMSRLKNPLNDFAYIAIAGPLSNLAQAAVWAAPFWLLLLGGAPIWMEDLLTMALYGVQINLALMVFNMLPVPPLDGSRVLAAFLPAPLALRYLATERYAFFILIFLLIGFRGGLSSFLWPIIRFFQSILLPG